MQNALSKYNKYVTSMKEYTTIDGQKFTTKKEALEHTSQMAACVLDEARRKEKENKKENKEK